MKAELIAHDGEGLTLQIKVKITGSLFEAGHAILDACNEIGKMATLHAMKRFDTDGGPIQVGEVKFTTKGTTPKFYETPYGAVEVPRHVYQTSQGGKTYCPLEGNARIIQNATPRFAQQISHKYSNLNAPAVCCDLEENHHRKIAHSYVQAVSDWVGGIASAKEETWEYITPNLNEAITSVAISLDGAFVLIP